VGFAVMSGLYVQSCLCTGQFNSELLVLPLVSKGRRLCLHLNLFDDLSRLIPSFAAGVHASCKFNDASHSGNSSVLPASHELTDNRKPPEVLLLAREHRIPHKVGYHPFSQLGQRADFPFHRVDASVGSNRATAEVSLDQIQHLAAVAFLADRGA
jgi:hypothetical protein